jgi:hypothetical protein
MSKKTNLKDLKILKKDDFKMFFDLLNNDKISSNNNRTNLPLIPQIYFNDNSSIIDQYYRIKVKLNKLEKTKELLFFILNSEKENFEKFTISREKNNLFERNLLPEFNEAKKYILVNTPIQGVKKAVYDKIHKARNLATKKKDEVPNEKLSQDIPARICSFLNKFKEKRSILKTSSQNQSHAFEIFNNEYYGKYRNYFIKIFNEYEKLRTDLFNEININNFGIMAFEHFFDLSSLDNLKIQKEQLLKKLDISKPSNSEYNKINYNKYVYTNNNANNNVLEEEQNKKSELLTKINEYNILYINSNNISYIKSNYKAKITKLYSNINTSIDTYVGKKIKNNLYDILKSAIDTDFLLTTFLCNYIDPNTFNKIIDNDFKIKKYIYKKISTFEDYYDQYKEWFNRININSSSIPSDSFGKLIDFETFYKMKFQDFFKK